MKNLVLFLIAVSLGVFTYFYQEKGDQKRFIEKQKEGQILDLEELGELKGFSLPQVKLAKQGEQFLFLDSGALVDERRVEWFLKILAGVKIKRVLEKEEWEKKDRSDFFENDENTMEFLFEGGRAKFTLGKKLDFARSFYMEVETDDKKSLVIAFDSGDHEAIYDKSEAHRSDHHYRRLVSLFKLNEDFFRDYRIFRHWMKKKWSFLEIEFKEGRNRDYTVNFPKATTVPPVPDLLTISKEAFLELEKSMSLLEAKSFLYKDKKFDSLPPLVKVVVNSTAGEARLSVFPHPEKKEEYLIHSSLDGHTYRVKKEEVMILLAPMQNYWDLRLLKENPESLKISFDKQSYEVKFKSEKGRFYAESNKKKAIHAAFKGLLELLKTRASYWTMGAEIEESSVKQFSLDWGQGDFFLMIRSGEIVLYHRESKQSLIYKIDGSIPIKVLETEYFYE